MSIVLSLNPSGDSDTQLGDIGRSDLTVNNSIVASGDAGETIEGISCVLRSVEPDIVISTTTDTANVVGTYQDPFTDTFQFVSKGSSNLTETPTTVVGVENVPVQKDLFNLNQDTRGSFTLTYDVVVDYDDAGSQDSESFVITQDITNEFEGIRSFIDNYYD
jgi:hypothetical protein